MATIDWIRAKEILSDALDIPPPEREAFISKECGSDKAMFVEVMELIRSYDQAGDFIEHPLFATITDDMVAESGAKDRKNSLIGQKIGQYQTLYVLGSGGMGKVYLAERADGAFRKKVAIKLLQPGANELSINRFLRERQILADIEHPNIARLIDGGTIDGSPYIVMEYVEGHSLREILRKEGALPLDRVIEIVKQICSGLDAAHLCGIIHRDIKPENLIVSEQEPHKSLLVKILDFGVAKLQQLDGGEVKTQTGAIIGSARYMSPEQAAGDSRAEIDARSDIYSLGAVIYEMITGHPVFKGSSYISLINQHLNGIPTPPHELRPDLNIPSALAEVVVKSLEKEPARRQQSAKELAGELERAYRDGVAPGTSKEEPAGSSLIKNRSGFKYLTLAIAAILCLAIVWFLVKSRPNTVTPATGPDSNHLANKVTDTGRRLQYQVLKKVRNDESMPLMADTVVREGDEIFFEITMPFAGECYLLYEERDDPSTPQDDSSLVWANPRPDQPPQRGQAGQKLRVPEMGWILFDDRSRKQNFIAFYVPDEVSWSLEDVVLSGKLKIKKEDVVVPYARIQTRDATALLKYLSEKAQQVNFTGAPAAGIYTSAITPDIQPGRIIYHRIVIWHGEK